MAEAFDPYFMWLGVRDPARPPNHYRLLGVRLFEPDPDVLAHAADRQSNYLRTFLNGPRAAEAQKLLDEIAVAKVCLLSGEQRAAYDAELRNAATDPNGAAAQSGGHPSVGAARGARAWSEPVEPFANDLAAQRLPPVRPEHSAANESPHPLSARWLPPVLIGGLSLAIVALVMLILRFGVFREEQSTRIAAAPAEVASQEKASDPPEEDASNRAGAPPSSADATSTPPPHAAPTPSEDSKPDRPAPPEIADRSVAPTEPGVGDGATSSADVQTTHGMSPGSAAGDVSEGPTGDGAAPLEPRPSDSPPAADAVAPVAPSTSAGTPSTEKGAGAPASEATPQSTTDVPVETARPGEATASATPAGSETTTPVSVTPAERYPVPSAKDVTQAVRMIRELFVEEYREASGPSQQRSLANMLYQRGSETRDDPTARFALYLEAQEQAIAAGDVKLLYGVTGTVSRDFELDPGAAVQESLARFLGKPRELAATRVAASAAIELAREMLAGHRYDDAAALVGLARELARRARDTTTVRLTVALEREVIGRREIRAAYLAAEETLKQNRDDPEANLVCGKYHCLVTGDWNRGLAMIRKGSDSLLKTLAEADAERHESVQEIVAIADRWWNASQREDPATQKIMQDRASYWYQRAYRKLKGPARDRVKRRLDELGQ
ncbi:MAG: hypothetical protein ACOY3P_12015 [Planctomycetota bacterium]